MVPGEVNGLPNGVVFMLDTNNGMLEHDDLRRPASSMPRRRSISNNIFRPRRGGGGAGRQQQARRARYDSSC